MARVLEHLGKEFIEKKGFPIPNSGVAESPQEAEEIHRKLDDDVVIKALVPAGKRKKAGAIKFPEDPQETRSAAREILGMTVQEFPVEKVLIEERLEIKSELYLSIIYDKENRQPLVIASTEGGIDVEEMSSKYPERIKKAGVHPFRGLPDYRARELWSELGFSGELLRKLTHITVRLFEAFYEYDCTTLEINPLVVTEKEEVVGADCVMAADDLAMFRQKELSERVQVGSERIWRPLTELEKRVVEVNERDPYRGTARYIELEEGEVGFMCGGGGGSLVMFDTLINLGLSPSNYTEFGGNPPVRKVRGLAKAILSKDSVEGLLVCCNITNNTQVDNVAQGVKEALEEKELDPAEFPVMVRFAGVNDERGKEIFESAGIEYHGEDITMPRAGRLMKEKLEEFNRQEGEQ
ncbi:ATP-grasp domain-containing protein [Halarsenatibacter silvermanii]|uniref:Succinyl-CoA synthetase (ADP-forming) beta subunit n=1 Tax=Halarsenatibacter silvermanii TaxID=321763 RepID=A0A1G9QKP7_9FIRM|nr:ATP-grasp domain-containing protein [Halarsenatibacter silvermanii]SDM11572.1 succinyl-CoA synthetase (ADP-forming) beta subunit [Halarsenatibacter silvermanii]